MANAIRNWATRCWSAPPKPNSIADIEAYASALADVMKRVAPPRRAEGADHANCKPREPLIFELSKPGRGAGTQFPPPVAGAARGARAFAPLKTAGAAGSLGAAGGAAFHAAVANELLHRHAFLSLGLMHHEVQPEGVQLLSPCCRNFWDGIRCAAGAAGISGVHVRAAGNAAGHHRHAGASA